MHAGYDVVQVQKHALREGQGVLVRLAHDAEGLGRVVAEQVALEVHDVRLGAAQKRHAVPGARPHLLVDEELEVAQVLLGEEHGAEVVRGAEELKAGRGGGADVLLDGGVGVAGEQRVGVHVAQRSEHVSPPFLADRPMSQAFAWALYRTFAEKR